MGKAHALVFLAEGAEEMEVTITVDVLRRAGIEVTLAGADGVGSVVASRGITLTPDAALDAVTGPFDIVVLPGGARGAERLSRVPAVGTWLKRHEAEGKWVGAICAAPIAFHHHGVFSGYTVTSYPSVKDVVGAWGSWVDRRVVVDRKLITSQGPGTAFEFALRIVRELLGAGAERDTRGPLLLEH
ncbi:MAG: DJ-1/PfpI family protein [Myxococcales bacterium]|nr:DJ-1/PfpI family protein [Myxococcales bacterium]